MLTKAISQFLPKNSLSRLENPTYSLTDSEAWDFSGIDTESGETVTHRNSLNLDAIFQAVTLISGDAAAASVNIFRKDMNTNMESIDESHPADYLVSIEANKEVSAYQYRRKLFAHALLWGNGYAFIDKNPSGSPRAIINLLPDRTFPARDENNDLFYVTEVVDNKNQRNVQVIKPDEIIHIKGFSIDNEIAVDLITKARESIGLALAAQNFGSKFFSQGAIAGGILEIPTHFSQEAKDNLEQGWSKRAFTGKDNWFKTAILRDGAKFHQLTIDAQKSQLHELREDQVRSIARFFNLPPFKLGLTESVSYNSTEQLQLIYLTGTLLPWLITERTEYNVKLRTEPQKRRRTHRFKHDPSPLLELDQRTQNDILQIQRQNFIITANEWRKEINRPLSSDPNADKLFNPNTTSTTKNGEQDDDNDKINTEPEDKNKRLISAHNNLIIHSCGVLSRRLAHDAKRFSKDSKKFVDWLDNDLKDNRILFHTAFESIVEVIAVSHDINAEDIMRSLEQEFFTNIVESLQLLTKSPYGVNKAQELIEAKTISFQNRIAAEMVSVFNSYLIDKD